MLSGGSLCAGLGVGALFVSNAAIYAGESFVNQSIKNGVKNVNYGEVAVDGIVGGIAAAVRGKGGGTKHLNQAGKQTVKRTVNKAAHKGFRAGVIETKKAIKHYFKSNKTYYKEYFVGLWKDVSFSLISIVKSRLKK